MDPNAQVMDVSTSAGQAASNLQQAHAQQAAQSQNISMKPIDPKYHYTDINTSNLNGIVPHITVDSRLTLLKDQPDYVTLIKLAIEKSIQEWANPVIDR